MNMLQLNCFIEMVNSGVESRAAEKMNISQPTLSKALSSLEAEMGVKLFDRVGRKLELNEHGKLFYTYIFDAMETIREGTEVITSLKKETLGTITISCQAYNGILSDCVKSYCEIAPHVNFRFVRHSEDGKRNALEASDKNIPDILLTHSIWNYNLKPATEDFPVEKKILDDEMLAVVSPKYEKFPAGKETISVSDFPNYTFILMSSAFKPQTTTFKLWNAALKSLDSPPIRIIEVSDLVHKLSMLSGGVGVAFLPKVCMDFAKKYDPSLRFFKIENTNLRRHIMLARRRKNNMSTQAMHFWDYALNYFGLPKDTEA